MLNNTEAIVRGAAGIMLRGDPSAVTSKGGHANYVTGADRETQAFLQQRLTGLLPGSEFYAEEKENAPLGDAPTWVVDPIDGTLNFIRGLAHSAISVALVRDRMVSLALVYDPYRDEMYTASRGGGAKLNGHPVRCSTTPLDRALCFFGTSPYHPALARATLETAGELLIRTADLRRSGSAALDLAWVACGRGDVFFEYSLSPWDYAAGWLLVTEAGGVFSLLDGQGFGGPSAVFASSAVCAAQAIEIVRTGYAKAGNV